MIVYRSDWAQEAGLEALIQLMVFIIWQKPLQRVIMIKTQKDTIGFSLGTVNNEIDCFDTLVVAFGALTNGIQEEKIIPSFMTDEYLQTLKWLRKMYQENLLSRDFAITKTTQIVPDIVNEEKLVCG